MSESKMYGFSVGDYLVTRVELKDEYDTVIPAGTVLELVAITPKVRIVSGKNKDTKQYFYNAVIPGTSARIRENFCTVKKMSFGQKTRYQFDNCKKELL